MSLFSAPPPDPDPPDRDPDRASDRETDRKDEPRGKFDPSKMRQKPDTERQQAPDHPLTVSQLAERVDAALSAGLPATLRVRGEVSNFNDRTHWYFALKDDSAVVSCVMFASSARRVGFRPERGQDVIATGRVQHYAPQGRTQLYVTRLEPVGAGALELRFRQLCDELRRLGWFAPERKRPIPPLPRRLAVVTSKTGAALQDVLDTLRRRAPFIDVLVVDVRVQGERAAPAVAAALRRLGRAREQLEVDTIILTRGGGSLEDLWAFNEREVAEAIVQSPIPVVAAIGHETDTTIAELVADLRAATPTQAAVMASPDRAALLEQLASQTTRLRRALQNRMERETYRLDAAARALPASARSRLHTASDRLHRLAARLGRHRPEAVYASRRATLRELARLATQAARRRIEAFDTDDARRRLTQGAQRENRRRRERVDGLERRLRAVSPVSVLERGYSLTTHADGRPVRSADDVIAGDRVRTRVADGAFESIVEGDADKGPPERPRRDGGGGSLFADR